MRWTLKVSVLALALGLIPAAGLLYGQSLGDVAREQRQKQQSSTTKSPAKVYTNEDVVNHNASSDDSSQPERSAEQSEEDAGESSTHASQSSTQWKSEIQRQKNTITSMQKQMDDLNASVHYVEANRYRDGVLYNQRQAQKQQQVERMRDQIEQEKRKLEQMQEGARRDGYGSAIYDP